MVAAHNIAPEMTFNSFNEFVDVSKAAIASSGKTLVDAVVVAVQDQMPAAVVIELAKHGYPMLCEKPMATTPEECIEMTDAAKHSGKVFGVGHGGLITANSQRDIRPVY
jgi:predicted dehydrogenase